MRCWSRQEDKAKRLRRDFRRGGGQPGGVIGFPALASTSMEQARRAVRHALGLAGSAISPLLPNGIYTIPEVSMVGETEESFKKKGVAYIVGRANYWENARGRIIGDED